MAQARGRKTKAAAAQNGAGAPVEAPQQGTIPEETLWAKLGRQAVEIDLLRGEVQRLAMRNQVLEETIVQYKDEFGELESDPEEEAR